MIMNNRFEKGETPIENVSQPIGLSGGPLRMAFLAFIQRSILIRSCDVESHSDFSRNFTHLMAFKSKPSHFYSGLASARGGDASQRPWKFAFIGFTSECLAIDEISFRNCTKLCKRRVHAEKSEIVLWVVLKLCKFALKVIKLNQVFFLLSMLAYTRFCFKETRFLAHRWVHGIHKKKLLPLLPRTRVQ